MRRRLLPVLAAAAALVPAAAQAQVSGLRVEGGPVWLTKSGKLGFGTSRLESDAGFALRGRLRYGVGVLAVAGEIQTSFQDYDPPAGPVDTLSATWLGVSASLAPLRLAGVAPYAEVGVGKLDFSDDAIVKSEGSTASVYGLGVAIGGGGRVAVDVGLRLMRRGGLRAEGVAGEFKYDPKLFSVLVSLRLRD